MVRRGVQRIEAMIFVLDLGSVGHHKTDFPETADDVLGHLGQRMQLVPGGGAVPAA